jgi:4-hydroxy-tetrahydrodipicolinate synthase
MKDAAESRSRLQGIFNITVTPFKADGALDLSALAENIERVIHLGYDGILIGGTYGEFPAMNPAERADLFRRASDVVNDRVPVMLCSAHSDPRIVRELTELAGALGGVPMVTPPFVSEVTDDQIVAFFRQIAPAARTGIVIYNAPGIGINLKVETIEKLADIASIVAIKQGDPTLTTIDILANRLRGRIRLFWASDLTFLGPLTAGFDGLSSTNSCALPELILRSFREIERGNARLAGDLHRLWYPLREILRRCGQPQTTKVAMNIRGFRGGSVRPPLLDLAPKDRLEVASALSAIAANPASALGALAA